MSINMRQQQRRLTPTDSDYKRIAALHEKILNYERRFVHAGAF